MGERGLVVTGARGVGKTAAWEALLEQAAGRFSVTKIVAGPATQRVPFGAMIGALPELAGFGTDGFGSAMELLRVRGRGDVHLLGVDCADQLDAESAAVVEQLVRVDGARLVATHPADRPLPDWLAGLVHIGLAELATLPPLDRDGTAAMLDALGCDVSDREAVCHVHRLSAGRPGLIRLLVSRPDRCLRAQCADAIADEGPLGRDIDRRLDALTPDQRSAFELIILSGTLELSIAEALVDPEAIEQLEANQLVGVVGVEGRTRLEPADPLAAERLSSTMPASRRRRLCRSLAKALATTGTKRTGDRMRFASLTIAGGGLPAPDTAVEAARDALAAGDGDLALQLAEAAGEGGGFEAALVLGQALFGVGLADRAASVLLRAAEQATTDDEMTRVAIARSELLAWANGRVDEALDVIEAAFGAVRDERWRSELRAEVARLTLAGGRPLDAEELGQRVAGEATASPVARLAALGASASAQVLAGRFAAVEADADRVSELLVPADAASKQASDRFKAAQAEALLFAGELDAADQAVRAACEQTDHSGGEGLWLSLRAHIQLVRGEIDHARQNYERAVALLQDDDPHHHLAHAFAGLGLTAAHAGDLAGIESTLVAHPFERDLIDQRTRFRLDRVDAWGTALRGDTAGAARRVLKVGLAALDVHHFVPAVVAFHDAVRFGHPEAVIDELASVAAGFEGALSPTFARHAAALAVEDGAGLDAIGERFERTGAHLLAAEAFCQAAAAHRNLGDHKEENRSRRRATSLLHRCSGARTPALAQRVDRLTKRQAQIARLAAHHSNEEIAETLGISVRTVESHLQSVYDKFGVHSRGELGDVLRAAER